MRVVIDIPDEKVNKYGNDVLKIMFTFVDRKVTQADGYTFYQLPKGHTRLIEADKLDEQRRIAEAEGIVSENSSHKFGMMIIEAETIIETDNAESEG